jgi:osmotically-inducible protein OsmY
MKTDAQIKDDVTEELRWDPQISGADAIGVAVSGGAVILSGHVTSYAEKMAAAQAAERVSGVKAVANDLKVELPGAPRDDVDIAEAIAHVLEWNVQVPEDRVHATVEHGWVTLEGEVDHGYQRREVERMIRHVRGVTGVLDSITVRPPEPDRPRPNPGQVRTLIGKMLERQAEADALHIRVEVSDHTARLYGQVHSLQEAKAAQAAAASAPGVASVESHLVITP